MAARIESSRIATVPRIAAALVMGGAVLVAASGFMVWLEVVGSELTGYRLAELISDFGEDLPGVPARWVGLAWYAIPALAAMCWLIALRRAPASASVAHAPIGLVLSVSVLLYLVLADVQVGPVVALIGALAVTAGGILHRA